MLPIDSEVWKELLCQKAQNMIICGKKQQTHKKRMDIHFSQYQCIVKKDRNKTHLLPIMKIN